MREAKENYRLSNTIINSASGFGKSYRKNIHNRIGFTRSYDHGESLILASAGLGKGRLYFRPLYKKEKVHNIEF